MSDEERYTLDEAKTEIARRACVELGHDTLLWMPMNPTTLDPEKVECRRCGRTWRLVPVEDEE